MIAAIYSLTIDPMTPSTMYASTAYGLFKSVDGGMNWLATGLPAGVPVLIDSRHPTTLYAAISNPVLQSTDGGKSWASINNGLPPSISALVIDPISGSTLYAAAYNYLLPNNPLGEGGVFEYQVVGPQEPNILASMESPEDGQPVSGIGVVRGWGFSTQADAQLSPLLPLIIDDVRGEDWFPCCSERGDVQAAFPQFPSSQTGKSGWGGVFNWGTLGSGPHTVQVPLDNVIYDPQGLGHLSARLFPALHTVTVIKPGDFEFLDRFDLSQASAGIAGNELVLTGVIVRDIFSQQQKKIDVHFRWFSNLQALGMVQSETTATLSSLCTVLSTLFASVSSHLRQGMGFVTNAHADSGITSYWESPEEGQAVSGIGILRGWAFSDDVLQMPLYESSIGSVQIIIDGEPYTTLPCCSPRADVSAVFPVPNAAKSGWALHFNYGILSPGPHTISVALTASHSPTTQTVSRIVQVVRVGGFPFLDQFDLAPASARIEGEDIVLSGVQVRDKASQQTKNIEVRARWFQNSQSLGIVASTE
jgi:hypothetical protein